MRVRVRREIRQVAHVRAKCVRGNISKCKVRACEPKYIAPNILLLLKLAKTGGLLSSIMTVCQKKCDNVSDLSKVSKLAEKLYHVQWVGGRTYPDMSGHVESEGLAIELCFSVQFSFACLPAATFWSTHTTGCLPSC